MKLLNYTPANVACARIILAQPERYGVGMVAWAQKVMESAESETEVGLETACESDGQP